MDDGHERFEVSTCLPEGWFRNEAQREAAAWVTSHFMAEAVGLVREYETESASEIYDKVLAVIARREHRGACCPAVRNQG